MKHQSQEQLKNRFLRYVRIDTGSDEHSPTAPSTTKQLDLQKILQEELEELGATEIMLSDYGCLFATIPATVKATVPTVAFLAHVDTTAAFSGANVKPIVQSNYNGQPIALPDDPSQRLSPEDLPYLRSRIGDDLITASGTTLLGADDKAGVAILMTMAAELLADKNIPHGTIRLCFTVDEEIGRGVTHLKLDDLAADVAYTLDGGDAGEIVYETFSADKALVNIKGVSAHPGAAKGIMVNALTLAGKLITMLPAQTLTPETTDGHDGFIHLYQMSGTAAEVDLHFILRDFERAGLEAHGTLMQTLCNAIQQTEPRATITCTISPQYRNMRYWLEDDMRPVQLAERAIRAVGLEPFSPPIRGGTDGSGLTEMGVPTPNLFTGMQNIHGPLEWISLQDMVKATDVCLELVQLWAEETPATSTGSTQQAQ